MPAPVREERFHEATFREPGCAVALLAGVGLRRMLRQFLAALAALLFSAATSAQTPASMNEQVVMVKVGSGLFAAELETTLFRPNGAGPFPLVVINHGKAPGNPVFQERARFLTASREFVRRG